MTIDLSKITSQQIKKGTRAPKCPKCQGPMVLRANRKTKEEFWGCVGYPKCRGTYDLAEGKRKMAATEPPIVEWIDKMVEEHGRAEKTPTERNDFANAAKKRRSDSDW